MVSISGLNTAQKTICGQIGPNSKGNRLQRLFIFLSVFVLDFFVVDLHALFERFAGELASVRSKGRVFQHAASVAAEQEGVIVRGKRIFSVRIKRLLL
jgi:hypothetical protein